MKPAARSGWPLARSILWSQRRKLALGFVILLLDRAAGLVVPLVPKFLLDEVVAHRRAELLGFLAGLVLAAAAVQTIASHALSRVLALSAERVVLGWRRRIMARLVRAPIGHFDQNRVGVLVSRVMDDAATMQNLVGSQLVRWASNVLGAALALAMLFYLDWRMTLFAVAIASIPGLCIDFAHRKMASLFRERSRLRAEIAGRLTQTLAGIRVVKTYAAERREHLAFTRGVHRLFRVVSTTMTRRSAMNAAATMATAAVVAIVVVVGGRALLEGRMSIGDFGSYIAFALTFAAPVLELPEIVTRASETLADLERLREVEELPAEDARDRGLSPLGVVRGAVTFEDVTFSYGAEPVLRDVSFHVPEGSTVALVGPSGAGKSTLLSLLLGLHRPDCGRIEVDGRDLATVRVREWRKNVAVVAQDDFLFDGTLAENIAFARPQATREEIEEACRIAHCDEFVRRFERGLDTIVGERGVRLSGGQRQRVSIARAVLAGARILLLDEATSHLDSECEVAVKEALATLRRGRTVFVIAHRLSTVRGADQILVLERGRIVERGTHRDLLERSGRYRALHEAQAWETGHAA